MVRTDTTGDPWLNITSTMPASYVYQNQYYRSGQSIKPESKEAKVTRLALERNRASWVIFNEPKPRIKQFIKPVNHSNQRR